ncbi:unnamed protein product [Rotaria sordida]|uniref:Uncharacterized protein n=1 Tax=Rotaria sordida TaxID=392033 RepID=A0A813YG26_9BILA|nr:unnamed protein product [Rotaria sordida]
MKGIATASAEFFYLVNLIVQNQWMINVDLSIKVMNKQNVYSILTNKLNRLNDIKQVQVVSLTELLE